MGSAGPQVQVAPRFEWRPLTRARFHADILDPLRPNVIHSFLRLPFVNPVHVYRQIAHGIGHNLRGVVTQLRKTKISVTIVREQVRGQIGREEIVRCIFLAPCEWLAAVRPGEAENDQSEP